MTPHFSLFPITGILFPIMGILFPITGIMTTLSITTLQEKNESCRYYQVPLYSNPYFQRFCFYEYIFTTNNIFI